jgi:hypothetical protein
MRTSRNISPDRPLSRPPAKCIGAERSVEPSVEIFRQHRHAIVIGYQAMAAGFGCNIIGQSVTWLSPIRMQPRAVFARLSSETIVGAIARTEEMSERIEIKGPPFHRRELVVDPLRAEPHPAVHGIARDHRAGGAGRTFSRPLNRSAFTSITTERLRVPSGH